MKARLRLIQLVLAGTMLMPVSVHAQAMSAADAAAMRAEIAALKDKVAAMEARLDAVAGGAPGAQASASGSAPAGVAATSTGGKPAATNFAWRGAVQANRDDGWSFKPKGRIQLDAGIVSHPEGVADRGLGFASEARRIRLGGEGSMPGGFGYKLEVELSDNSVELVDTFITYKTGGLTLALGNQNQFQSLDELISDTLGSTMERAAFTDAFNFERRLGLSAEYQKGLLLAQAGVFTDSLDAVLNGADGPNGGDENNSYAVDGRVVFAPKLGQWQLHMAGSAHWRNLGRLVDSDSRYRQRPYLHTANTRFIDTGVLKVKEETHYGLELAGVSGRFHFAGEAHWLKLDRLGALPDPTFFGAYGEVGYYLTGGDTRAYKKGIFDRSPPKNPVGEGGIGSIQVNLRYDYLDMDDAGILGGKQDAYIAALIWSPINYVRFNVNYARLAYDAYPGNGLTPAIRVRRNFSGNAIGFRAELDY